MAFPPNGPKNLIAIAKKYTTIYGMTSSLHNTNYQYFKNNILHIVCVIYCNLCAYAFNPNIKKYVVVCEIIP